MRLSDAKFDSLYVMLKGEQGTRKSTQALTFPMPQYWFSGDKKMGALRLPIKHFGINSSQIEYDDYNDWSKIAMKLEAFQVKCPFKTLIFDSITSIGDLINLQTMRSKAGEARRSGEDAGRKVGGITVNTLEDYKAEASAFVELIDKTKDISAFHKVNIILIAHVVGERDKKEVGTTTHSRIIVTGGKIISGKIPAYCDEIYHFDSDPSVIEGQQPEFKIFTTNAGDDYARTSLPLPPIIKIKDGNLYKDYVEPAVVKLNSAK